MSAIDRPGPASLARLQAVFSAVLHTPPMVTPERAPAFANMAPGVNAADDASARARLEVYRQQYWSRLHNVMVDELPLTRFVLGERPFQTLCVRYLRRHPPTTFDLHDVVARLPQFLDLAEAQAVVDAAPLGHGLAPKALVRAVGIDIAYGQVFLAPAPCVAEPWPTRPDGLKHRTLPLAPHARVIRVPAPLLRQRAAVLAATAGTSHNSSGEACDELSPFLLLGSMRGVRAIPLPPMHAQLLELLQTTALEPTIAELKRIHPELPRHQLQAQVQRWLADDTRLGIFRDQPRRQQPSRRKGGQP